jgi:hypothetical protein
VAGRWPGGQRLVRDLRKINGDQRLSIIRALAGKPQSFDE